MPDFDDVVTAIDVLHGTAREVFGENSQTSEHFTRLYNVACAEAKELERLAGDQSATDEYRQAFAAHQRADAIAMRRHG